MQTIDSVLSPSTTIDPGVLQPFCLKAVGDVANIRRGILLVVQGSDGDLNTPVRELRALKLDARDARLPNIEELCQKCESVLTDAIANNGSGSGRNLNQALDILVEIEATLLENSLGDDDAFPDVSGFIDASFAHFTNETRDVPVEVETDTFAEFEIDEETFEIFRSEANDLLESISKNIESLTADPRDRDALWNIRRCAHTFKGAAGIVGMKKASELAHRVEDLLDQLAEKQCDIDAEIICLLSTSTDCLNSMTLETMAAPTNLAAIYDSFERVISRNETQAAPKTPITTLGDNTNTSEHSELVRPMPAPIVRVALTRLDELLEISRELDRNRAALADSFSKYTSDAETLEQIGSLFEAQRRLTSEMQDKLLDIRMVRFGMLTTRLNRAVHVTCQEEGKKAEVIIENEDIEIDTQILDSLVEPLLHLLRNAVVHGIELPETRRLIGKPETGQIRIRVDNNGNAVIVSVHDDGRGISSDRLKERAIASGAISHEEASSLTSEKALGLMFLKGVTTADTLSINAGRGVGMSIVKESVESGGGSVTIDSESQKGTTFTIRMPVALTTEQCEATTDVNENIQERRSNQSANLTVFIVDDSPGMRQLITKIVEKAGWTAITASHGQDALEKLNISSDRPDIILTDLEMPCMNGYELIEELKKDGELRGIPVVMITSRTDPDYRRKAFDLGVDEFLTKPFEGSSLIKIIDRLTVATTAS